MKKLFLTLTILFVTLNYTNANVQVKTILEGNINAKIKLIVYESLTCSHCADFHKEIYPELKKEFIDTGLVKIEFRHFPLDMAAFNASKIAQDRKSVV